MEFNDIISKYRTGIMGFAMMAIMLGHQPFFFESHIVGFFHIYGSWGVDLFLFVSGFGITHSLRKNSVKQFYKNRANRLIPTCVFVGLAKYILKLCGFEEFTSDNFILFVTNIYLWYIYAIIVYYIVSPLLYKLLHRYGVYAVISICLVSLLCSYIPFHLSPYYLVNHIGWLTARLPVYVLGMYAVMYPIRIKLKYIILGGLAICALAAFLKLTTIMIRFKWDIKYLNLLVMLSTPMLCLLACKLTHYFKILELGSIVDYFGKYSLELYLWHEFIFWNLLKNENTASLNLPLMATIALLLSLVSAYITKIIVDKVFQPVFLCK
ncbi:MAG: acyltransferase [bacterium]|nr:acyltransferase [bacterium]